MNNEDILRNERNALGRAIRNAAVKVGICNEDASLTGAQLVMLCDNMVEHIQSLEKKVERKPVAWKIEDLILHWVSPAYTEDEEYVKRVALQMHNGKPCYKITPLYGE